ncbi:MULTISPECIES: hypothetical protein [unclassified Variovorax]|uniref:hypothetical protein n=1 Tax=unclassified Variovorax TaxID=663243 RepID=UPI0025749B9D|nr:MULTISPECIES: hypothetical protein [unclassified Variovorax]MDM0088899.1 hypothetical protein [Variovorax sp. J22G40]MDM0146972.1 hypothetical protein [Variovorax sp. J2P1-31]
MKFVIIPEQRNRWSWELRNAEGTAISRSVGSYSERVQAEHAIQALRRGVANARVLGPTGASLDEFVARSTPDEKASR